MRNAEQLVRYAARKVETLFKRQKQIHAMYHYVRSDGSQGAMVVPLLPEVSKDAVVAFAKAVFETENVVAYVFISEVWQWRNDGTGLTREQLAQQYGDSLENVPGRTEHVLLMGEDETGMVYGNMEIHRPLGREPYLGALKIDRPDDMEGRMVGLLPVRGTKQ